MSRVDAHIHLFAHGYPGGRPHGADLADYERLRSAAGIEAALVVGYEGEGFAGNNDYILDVAAGRPWVLSLPYLELTAGHSRGSVAEWFARGARGVSVYLDAEASGLGVQVNTDAGVWEAIADAGAVVSVNAPAAAWTHATAWAVRQEFPILVSHLGLPGAAAASGPAATDAVLRPVLELAEKAPHVHVKLSGAYAIDPAFPHTGAVPAITRVFEAFGPARIVWGSDFSPALGSVRESELFALPAGVPSSLTQSQRGDLLGGNLRRLLRLPADGGRR